MLICLQKGLSYWIFHMFIIWPIISQIASGSLLQYQCYISYLPVLWHWDYFKGQITYFCEKICNFTSVFFQNSWVGALCIQWFVGEDDLGHKICSASLLFPHHLIVQLSYFWCIERSCFACLFPAAQSSHSLFTSLIVTWHLTSHSLCFSWARLPCSERSFLACSSFLDSTCWAGLAKFWTWWCLSYSVLCILVELLLLWL